MSIAYSNKELNEIRGLAHELIIKLYDQKAVEHLELLKRHCERALEEIESRDPEKTGE